MTSPVIRPIKSAEKSGTEQLTLNFQPGLVDRHGSLRDCIASGVYHRGLKRIAGDLDQAPGNLSVQLSDDNSRHFSVDSLERYIEKTRDMTPVLYLIEKFLAPDLRPKGTKEVLALRNMMAEMQRQLEALGGTQP